MSGVLPIALSRACKLTGFFLGENKEYVGIMRVHEDVSLKKINKAIKDKFIGKIKQIPPVKSRVARIEREREVKKFEILEQKGKDFLFKAEVQGGTYIRKLIDDLGKELGIGAHMLELRRIRAGVFNENLRCVNLYDFEEAVGEYKKGDGNDEKLRSMIIPGEIISKLYDIVDIKKESVKRLFNGSPLFFKDLKDDKKPEIERGKKICVFSEDKFIGIYSVINSGNVFAKPEFVLQPIQY